MYSPAIKEYWKVPIISKTSHTKLKLPGKPALLKEKNNKKKANKGILFKIPLKYNVFFVWKIWYRIPAKKNSPADVKPCAIIPAIAPLIPSDVEENSPTKAAFMCDIEE